MDLSLNGVTSPFGATGHCHSPMFSWLPSHCTTGTSNFGIKLILQHCKILKSPLSHPPLLDFCCGGCCFSLKQRSSMPEGSDQWYQENLQSKAFSSLVQCTHQLMSGYCTLLGVSSYLPIYIPYLTFGQQCTSKERHTTTHIRKTAKTLMKSDNIWNAGTLIV